MQTFEQFNYEKPNNTIIITQFGVFMGLENMSTEVVPHGSRNRLSLTLKVKPSIIAKIKLSQKGDTKLERLRQIVIQGKSLDFVIHEDGTLRLRNRLSIPNKEELKGRF